MSMAEEGSEAEALEKDGGKASSPSGPGKNTTGRAQSIACCCFEMRGRGRGRAFPSVGVKLTGLVCPVLPPPPSYTQIPKIRLKRLVFLLPVLLSPTNRALGSWSGVPAALLPPVSSEEAANSTQESGEKATTQPPTASFTAIGMALSSKINARPLFCLLACLFVSHFLGEN
jgi:hypothetical protein